MSLATIVAALDTFAQSAVSDAVAEGKTFVAQEVTVIEQAGETTVTNAAIDFQDLVSKYGALATQLVTAATSNVSIPLVNEQQNLAATTLIQTAASDGITVTENDATTLINNAEVAVAAWIAKL